MTQIPEEERLARITCCCSKMEHCRQRQKEAKDKQLAGLIPIYREWEMDWLHELHILLYTPVLSNFDLPDVFRAGWHET